jgi:FkbM family methyltransferase
MKEGMRQPMAAVKRLLKAARTTQPFNATATSIVKAALGATGRTPDVVVKHLHRVGRVRAKLPNGRTLRLWSRGDDWVSNQVYWRGWDGYDRETAPVFFRLAARSTVVFDVGAYVGFYSLLAGHANPDAMVHSFEPLRPVYERLARNVSLNGLSNVRCHLTAVGEQDGTAEFYHVEAELPTSSSLSYDFMSGAPGLRHSTVPVVRLDRFAEENRIRRVDLLKVDTESTEPQVLRGMRGVLERDRPDIICEVLEGRGTEAGLEAVLAPLGYRYYLLTTHGPRQEDRIVGHPEWLNYLMTTRAAEELEEALAPPA